jgi:hypothetical protein
MGLEIVPLRLWGVLNFFKKSGATLHPGVVDTLWPVPNFTVILVSAFNNMADAPSGGSCATTRWGCCPDGKTPAQGHAQAGCPGTIFCIACTAGARGLCRLLLHNVTNCHWTWLLIKMTGWHGKQWGLQNNEKTIKHSVHWIMIGWHGEQLNFQNNEKTIERSDHWIVIGWYREQYMEHSDHWETVRFSKQWKDNRTFWSLEKQWSLLFVWEWCQLGPKNHLIFICQHHIIWDHVMFDVFIGVHFPSIDKLHKAKCKHNTI